ncbi:MAG: monofunctional biosynthetic peptidoglycan transglycosylase [Neisseriaceae bacterium]|nr:monofunctional biosynthetic peptidoglycan transglycosylase [Neisseriaceae bacterium]
MKHIIQLIVFIPVFSIIGLNIAAFGSILFYRAFYPHKTVFMHARTPKNVAIQYKPVKYEDISIHLKKAIIAAEDAKFAQHSGFDWQGIQNAVKKNKKTGKIKAGGSTISQQTAKNLFLIPNRSFIRKGEEAVMTAMLEATTDKERILALYLNIIEWGEGLFGAEAAAQYYYHKTANQLTPKEAALLASMPTHPVYYQQHLDNKRLKNKTKIIQKRMKNATLPQADD